MQRSAVPRVWHVLTAVVAAGALAFQLVLVFSGEAVLDETTSPGLATRLVRFASYFTILSNVLVLLSAGGLATGRDTGSRPWRVLRVDAVVCIAVTAVVHWFALRPLLDLEGANAAVDVLLHQVVPVLAVVGWVLAGPRGRVLARDLPWAAVVPAAWMAYTVVRGAFVHWYPYPFTDVDALGYPRVLLNGLGVVALLAALAGLLLLLDRRLPGPREEERPRAQSSRW